MSPRKQLKLGAFMRPVSIHTGAWRYPGAFPDANFNFAHIRRFIQTLERGRFDAFFMADHLALLNMPVERLVPALNPETRAAARSAPETVRNLSNAVARPRDGTEMRMDVRAIRISEGESELICLFRLARAPLP